MSFLGMYRFARIIMIQSVIHCKCSKGLIYSLIKKIFLFRAKSIRLYTATKVNLREADIYLLVIISTRQVT